MIKSFQYIVLIIGSILLAFWAVREAWIDIVDGNKKRDEMRKEERRRSEKKEMYAFGLIKKL